jgi:hypothetical protein
VALFAFGFGDPFSLTFGDLDSSAGDISGVSVVTFGVSGIEASDLSFTAHSVTIDVSNSGQWDPGDNAIISLTFANAPVPMPPTVVLLAFAVAGLGAGRIWRRR